MSKLSLLAAVGLFTLVSAAAPAVAAEPSLVGSWTAKSRDAQGREFSEVVEFTEQGRFALVIRDAAGNTLARRAGTYTLADGRALRLTSDTGGVEGVIAFAGADRFHFTLNGQTTAYQRVGLLGALVGGPAAKADVKARPVPAGFQARRPANGTGEVLVSRRADGRSAKKALGDALKELTAYFDERPALLEKGVVVDQKDTSVQAFFRVKAGGKESVGAAFAVVVEGEAYVTVVYDEVGRPLAPLINMLGAGGAAAPQPAVNVRWFAAQLPDGSGNMNLPEGWKIESAHKGAVIASGPHGRVELGMGIPVTSIEADAANAAHYARLGVPYARPSLVASDKDPVAALQQLIPQFSAHAERAGGARTTLTRIVEAHPVAWQNGKAAIIHGDVEIATRGQKVAVKSVALVAVMPAAAGQFVYYYSSVSSPAEGFQANLPILLGVWKSWRVADWVHTERMLGAMKSLREAGDLYQQAIANQQRSSDRVWRAWGEYNRGVHAVLDTRDNRVGTVQLQWVDDMVGVLNKQEGYERFRKVTPFEINY